MGGDSGKCMTGGTLARVTEFTLDGDDKAIAATKEALAKKVTTCLNISFSLDNETSRFVGNIMAFPITYVIDRDGNVLDNPILVVVTSPRLI